MQKSIYFLASCLGLFKFRISVLFLPLALETSNSSSTRSSSSGSTSSSSSGSTGSSSDSNFLPRPSEKQAGVQMQVQ